MQLSRAEKLSLRHLLWERGELSFLLWPQQLRIYERVKALPAHIQKIVFEIARQFGKSVMTCLLAMEDCLQNPGVLVMIIGPDIKQTRGIVNPRVKLLQALGDCPRGLINHHKSSDTYLFSNGSEIKLGGFDTNALSERGKTIYKIYLEEIAFSNPDKYHDFIRSDLGPALLHSANAQIYFVTTPPKYPDHPFLADTVPEAKLLGSYFRYTIDDNEALSPEQKEKAIREGGGIDSVDVRREYYCEVVRDPSVIVVPEFDESRHVKEFELPKWHRTWLSGDTGGVRDRTCLLLCAYDFERAKVLIVDERAFDNQTGSKVMIGDTTAMEALYRPVEYRRVDAPGQTITDWGRDHGFWVALPRKAGFDETVQFVRTEFTFARVEIHPRCRFLIESLRSQQFDAQRKDFLRTKALGHGDGIMALAYALRSADKSNPVPRLRDRYRDTSTHYVGEMESQEQEQEQDLGIVETELITG